MMPLNRRNVLIVLGVLTVAGGALFGAGAFSQVSADRTVSASTAGDGDAYLQFQSNSSYTDVSGSPATFSMTLDSLNTNANTTVDYAFNVSITSSTSGTYDVYVESETGVGDGAELNIQEHTSDSTIVGSGNAVSVSAGATEELRIVVQLADGGDVTNIPSEITFVAEEQ